MSGILDSLGIPSPGNNLSDPTKGSLPPLQVITPAEPVTEVDTAKYYFCSVRNASMHSPGGTRVVFDNSFYTTRVEALQQFLDTEIKNAHLYLRHATEDEIRTHNMRINPKKVIEDELRPQIEMEIRERLEKEIREEYANKGITSTSSYVEDNKIDAEKLAGVSKAAASSIRDRLLNIRSGTGVVTIDTPPPQSSNFQSSVTGSDKTGGNEEGSTSASPIPGL